MAVEKRLIAFKSDQFKNIEQFANENKRTFTDAVRILINLGLQSIGQDKTEDDEPDLTTQVKDLKENIEKLSWWTLDDNTSKLHNIEVALEDMEKKINVLTSATKLFKSHVEDREIHLVD